jgi:hypothetical protein
MRMISGELVLYFRLGWSKNALAYCNFWRKSFVASVPVADSDESELLSQPKGLARKRKLEAFRSGNMDYKTFWGLNKFTL